MKPSTGTLALGLLLAMAAPGGIVLASDPGEQVLLERASYWLTKNRVDLAADALSKVLAVNPSQPDALYRFAMLAVQRGDQVEAQRYFARLQQVAQFDPRAAELLKTAPQTAPELLAGSADSDDLTAAPPGGQASGRSAADGQVATAGQLAQLSTPATTDAEPGVAGGSATPPSSGSAGASIAVKPTQVAQVELLPPPPIGASQTVVSPTLTQEDTLDLDINRSLAQIESDTNPMLQAGAGLRAHGGTEGLVRLTEVGTPVEFSFSPWLMGTARFSVLPVYLDAGSVSAGNLSQFGANALLAAKSIPMISPGDQSATGVGLLGGYGYGPFSGQIGTSPLGFPVTNLVGNVAFAPKFLDNTVTVRVEGIRQPVIDSVLSYAGTHASLSAANSVSGGGFGTNATWGGVVKTGGHVIVSFDDNSVGVYGGAGVAELTGENVSYNSVIDALAGVYFRPYRTDTDTLRVGVAVNYLNYDKNLSGFTFGQGGYFSPQNYETLTFPVEYIGHSGYWSYLGSVAIGVEHFNEDGSPLFPNNAGAQAALQAIAGSGAFYRGTSSIGPAFNLKGQIEYAIDNTLSVGASASLDNAKSYTEGIGKIYVRKTFDWWTPLAGGSDPSIVSRDQPQSRL